MTYVPFVCIPCLNDGTNIHVHVYRGLYPQKPIIKVQVLFGQMHIVHVSMCAHNKNITVLSYERAVNK